MTVDFEKIKHEYQKRVPRELFEHNVRVADLAYELAERFGADPKKAKIAGLIHDLAFPRTEELLELADKYRISYGEIEKQAPILLHGLVGAEMVKEVLGIDDPKICSAIKKHTTGGAEMSVLDKVVFLADKIDPELGLPGAEEVTELSESSLNKAIIKYCDCIIPYQIKQGFSLHPDLVATRNKLLLDSKKS